MRSALIDISIALTAFTAAAALAGVLGAANLGTALGFGQIAFAAAVIWLIAQRR